MKPYVLDRPMTTDNVKFLLSQFKCRRCERPCCVYGTNGFLLKTNEDVELADSLNMPLSRFKKDYTFTKNNKRFMNAPCSFYKDGCTIYSHRPQVCRQYPFNRSYQGNITVNPNCPAGRVIGEKYGVKV